MYTVNESHSGLSIVNKCLKGGDCNFLHVFRNPGNRFPFTASDGTSCAGQTPRRSGQTPYVTKYGIDVLRYVRFRIWNL